MYAILNGGADRDTVDAQLFVMRDSAIGPATTFSRRSGGITTQPQMLSSLRYSWDRNVPTPNVLPILGYVLGVEYEEWTEFPEPRNLTFTERDPSGVAV